MTDGAVDDQASEDALFKQSDVLKKVLNDMFDDDQNTLEFDIKLEIASIIDHFMDWR